MIKRLIFTLACLLVTAGIIHPALAHEFWIEPQEFQVESDTPIAALLKNGQEFEGVTLAYLDRRIVRFDWQMGGAATPVVSRAGDNPALVMTPPEDGLLVLVYEATRSTVKYREWEKFVAFADHKAFSDIKARHDARALPEADFTEVYARFAKSLIGVGGAAGMDRETGLETEIIALENPYTRENGAPLPVKVIYQGTPRPAAQVEIFARGPDGVVVVTTVLTDPEGVAQIPVQPGYDYLLDSVVLRIPAEDVAAQYKAVCETLWASLSFSIPK